MRWLVYTRSVVLQGGAAPTAVASWPMTRWIGRLHLILVVAPLDFFFDTSNPQHRAIKINEPGGSV